MGLANSNLDRYLEGTADHELEVLGSLEVQA
jgi:hypothetical protein